MRNLLITFCCAIILAGCIGEKQNEIAVATPVATIRATSTVTTSSTTFIPVKSTGTSSRTPFPTSTLISTPTSDFQSAQSIVSTLGPPAVCPPIAKSEIVIPTDFPLDEHEFEDTVINILNNGGVEQLLRYLSDWSDFNKKDFRFEDLTNDGVRELVIRNWSGNLSVFGCKNGKFVNLLTEKPVFLLAPKITAIRDMNHNGVKELVIEMETCQHCTGMKVYEWNGGDFESLVRNWQNSYPPGKLEYTDIAELDGYSNASVADIDNNDTFELILEGGMPSYTSGWTGWDGPWRGQNIIYMWDGKNYVWYSQKYDPPIFRFEAIQDGDTETIRGDYDLALKSYQAAIFDDKLKSWTQEAWRDLLQQNEEAQLLSYPDIQKMPFNQMEYDQLSAYARYRIMILYLKQGWESDAKTAYESLIEKYPQGNSGYPYTELATEFWNEYQASHDLNLSCDEAIAYVTNHPEILDSLGSHGLFDAYYEPEDICPFKQ